MPTPLARAALAGIALTTAMPSFALTQQPQPPQANPPAGQQQPQQG